MKLSISISDLVGSQLRTLVSVHNSNPSAVVESALRTFVLMPEANRQRAVRETHASKKALTQTGWMTVFWEVLAEQFDAVDFAERNTDRVMAPRAHNGFTVVFLLANVDDSAPPIADFMIHIFESPPHDASQRYLSQTFCFNMDDSVYDAARKTAAWIRERQPVRRPVDS